MARNSKRRVNRTKGGPVKSRPSTCDPRTVLHAVDQGLSPVAVGGDGRDHLPRQGGQGRGVAVVGEAVQQGQGFIMGRDLLVMSV